MSKEDILSTLNDYNAVMFGTYTQNNKLEFRPMAIAGRKKNYFYFITAKTSGKIASIEDNQEIYLTAQSNSSYLSVRARGVIQNDLKLIEEFWNSSFQTWFPNGPKDINVCLLRFEPVEGELWDDNYLIKAKYIWEVIKSNLSGNRPELKDNHEKFNSL